ncbi:tyrosinase [Pilimelia terevasa]|uniref:Tyrosinase n=1 Tax=Pilimelia terevasa TaxID=53372 RepID=A0A8J3BKF7_9ACTN|nr:tyrosinase family protein [Pilimelia terevasa]GGK20922.1 tyrosinase [Pilimelia terevasa]
MTVVRQDQATLDPARRRAFLAALLALKRQRPAGAELSVYDGFVRTHDRYFRGVAGAVATHAHGAWSFLPWHRRFLLDFEDALRAVDPQVSVPWWDWRRGDAGLFADDFLGPADDRDPHDSPLFAAATWPIAVPGQLGSATLRRRLRPAALPRRVADDLAEFAEFTEALEEGPHNAVHVALGGHMASGASPNDPVFWLHHCFLDRLWSRWQDRYGADAYPARGSGRNRGRYDAIGPWPITPDEVLDHRARYTYPG